MITGRKSLAKTSGRPGKTQLINHFIINNNWHLVDLPGYGYAKVSKTAKKKFQQFITDYFLRREQMVWAFVLIDIRHEPQKIDLEFMQWMGENAIPFSIVFTKADKLKPKAIERNVNSYITILLETWETPPKHFITSSSSSIGKEELLEYIDQMNQQVFTN
jgi:GTP-binding protein